MNSKMLVYQAELYRNKIHQNDHQNLPNWFIECKIIELTLYLIYGSLIYKINIKIQPQGVSKKLAGVCRCCCGQHLGQRAL